MMDLRTASAPKGLAALAGLCGLVLYVATCAPGVLWQDSAMFQFRVWQGDFAGQLGLPLAHPLYAMLCWLFCKLPLGEFAWRVNLFSAVCAAACLVVAFDLIWQLTRCRRACAVGTALLAVSHTFWTHAVIAEVYTLYVLALLIEFSLLVRYYRRPRPVLLALAAFVCGLNLSNHLFALLHGPIYVGTIAWALHKKYLKWEQAAWLVIAFLLGATPYLWLIGQYMRDGHSLGSALYAAFFGDECFAPKILNRDFHAGLEATRCAQYFGLNFPTPLVLLAPVGAWAAWRRRDLRPIALAAATLFTIDFVFAFRYPVPDQFVFYMPGYVIFVLAISVGVAVFRPAPRKAVAAALWVMSAAMPIACYELLPPLLARWNVSIGAKRELPFRDSYAYFLRPRKNAYDGAERFARLALAKAAPDGLLIADVTVKNVLVYVRDVLGVERGVTLHTGADTTSGPPTIRLTPERVRGFALRGKALACSNLPPYIPEPWLFDEYDFVPDGPLYVLQPRTR